MGYYFSFYIYLILVVVILTILLLPLWFIRWPNTGTLNTIHAIERLVIFALYIFGVPWIARSATKRKIDFGQGFFKALSGAFSEVRLGLSMLPVIGLWFQSDSSANSFDDSRPIE